MSSAFQLKVNAEDSVIRSKVRSTPSRSTLRQHETFPNVDQGSEIAVQSAPMRFAAGAITPWNAFQL
jgi:hypothetical protein